LSYKESGVRVRFSRFLEVRLAKVDLKEYARRGAAARVAELRAELAEIYRAFPGLRRTGGTEADGTAGGGRRRTGRRKGARKRREMSKAEKRAVSLRMKRYWANRKKTEKAEKGPRAAK
jgi:hypothetical protein